MIYRITFHLKLYRKYFKILSKCGMQMDVMDVGDVIKSIWIQKDVI